MKYESFDRNGKDIIISHYVYTPIDTDPIDLYDFLEENGVDVDEVEYVEYERIPGRHIWHQIPR